MTLRRQQKDISAPSPCAPAAGPIKNSPEPSPSTTIRLTCWPITLPRRLRREPHSNSVLFSFQCREKKRRSFHLLSACLSIYVFLCLFSRVCAGKAISARVRFDEYTTRKRNQYSAYPGEQATIHAAVPAAR